MSKTGSFSAVPLRRVARWTGLLLSAFVCAVLLPLHADPPAPAAEEDTGVEITEQSEVEKKLGIKLAKRQSKHFRLETYLDQKAAAEAIGLAEKTYKELHELFAYPASPPVFSGKKATMLQFKDNKAHTNWLKELSGYPADQISRYQPVGATHNNVEVRWEAWQGQNSKDWYKDTAVHHTAHLMVNLMAGIAPPKLRGWTYEGLAYYLSLKLGNVAEVYCAGSSGKETAATATGIRQSPQGSSAAWRSQVKGMVQKKKDPSMKNVMTAGYNEFNGDMVIKAWSVVDYFAAEKKKEFGDYIKSFRKSGSREEAEKDIDGRTVKFFGEFDQLQKDWSAWVLKTY